MFNPAEEMSSISFDKIIGGALNAVVSAQNTSAMTTVEFIKNVGFVNDAKGNAVRPVCVDFTYPKEVAPYRPAVPESYYIKINDGGKDYDANELNSGAYEAPDGVVVNFETDGDGKIVNATIVNGADKIADGQSVTIKNNKVGSGADLAFEKRAGSPEQSAQYRNMTLHVPLLTIVPIPFIRIASTDLEFNVKINSIAASENSNSTNVTAGMSASLNYRGIVKASLDINASVAHQQKKSETEEVKKEYSLNVKIHAVQDEMPAGMSRILDILEESIVPKAAQEKKSGE